MLLGGAKDEHFSYFHSSCQLGLSWKATYYASTIRYWQSDLHQNFRVILSERNLKREMSWHHELSQWVLSLFKVAFLLVMTIFVFQNWTKHLNSPLPTSLLDFATWFPTNVVKHSSYLSCVIAVAFRLAQRNMNGK